LEVIDVDHEVINVPDDDDYVQVSSQDDPDEVVEYFPRYF
jgi:hypothetical protein